MFCHTGWWFQDKVFFDLQEITQCVPDGRRATKDAGGHDFVEPISKQLHALVSSLVVIGFKPAS